MQTSLSQINPSEVKHHVEATSHYNQASKYFEQGDFTNAAKHTSIAFWHSLQAKRQIVGK